MLMHAQLQKHYVLLRRTFLYYCQAGAVGDNDPYSMTLTQWNEFTKAGGGAGGGAEGEVQADCICIVYLCVPVCVIRGRRCKLTPA